MHETTEQLKPPTDAGLAAWLHNFRSQQAKAAMARRVASGECAGRAPVGYTNTVVGERRTVAVDPVLGPLVAEAFRLSARRDMSIRKVLGLLVPKGLVGQGGKPMGVSGLQMVLGNPFYTGFVRLDGRLHPGNHESLVSKSLFQRVHSRLFRRRSR